MPDSKENQTPQKIINEKTAQIPENPLGRIAICMSGGGYRAAVFQLGMMSYLNHLQNGSKPLLENVKAISTVSGGTITGVVYSSLLKEGKSFKEIYNLLIKWLEDTDLVKQGLEKVSKGGNWNFDYKRKNLVNAFAELYNETLTEGLTLEVFKDIEKKEHLEYVCFNSTEFKSGLRFRFQMAKGQNYVGANKVNLKEEVYKNFRLGDIIAASSAFSGGFEPISMPRDFISLTAKEKIYFDEHKGYLGQEIGLMDGGIYDNQGISSIEDYQDIKGIEPFDLILISDVASPYIDSFEFFEEKTDKTREKTFNEFKHDLKIKSEVVFVSLWVYSILGIVLTLASNFNNSTVLGIGISVTVSGLFFLFGFYYLHTKYRTWKTKIEVYAKKIIPPFFIDRIGALGIDKIKIKSLEGLLQDRLGSLKLLLPTIFLKQIRRLHYNRIYENKAYEYRRLTCLVKELTKIDFDKKKGEDYSKVSGSLKEFAEETYEELMGEKLIQYVDRAGEFGTTLWFTEEDELKDRLESLLISGQSTCCQNILIYLEKVIKTDDNGFKELDVATKDNLIKMRDIAREHWNEFKIDPKFLHNELSK